MKKATKSDVGDRVPRNREGSRDAAGDDGGGGHGAGRRA